VPPLRYTSSWSGAKLIKGQLFPGCEADHSPPSIAEVKNAGTIPLTYKFSWLDAQLINGQLYLSFALHAERAQSVQLQTLGWIPEESGLESQWERW
jgi:hypothetical protein